jgi:hypothetical protein
MRKPMGLVLLALAMVAGASLPAVAQGDLKGTLVGRWEGDIQGPVQRANPDRTLVIDPVSGQSWRGRFGITGKGLSRVTGEMDSTGTHPVIAFQTDAGSKIALRLHGQKSMEGTINPPGSGQRLQDLPIRLQKVERAQTAAKAGKAEKAK